MTTLAEATAAAAQIVLGRYVRIELARSESGPDTGCVRSIELLPWRAGMSLPALVAELARQAEAATREDVTGGAARALAALQAAIDPAQRTRWNPAVVERLLQWPGSPRRKQILQALLRVPFGQTVSYGELARRVSPPSGARAVGQTMNRNPFPLIVPCHRVIQTGGGLGGFGGGLDWKRALLEWEARHCA